MAKSSPTVTINVPKPKNSSWSCKGSNLVEVFKNLKKHKWWGRYRSHEDCKAKKVDSKTKNVTAVELSGKPEIIMPKWAGYGKATKAQKASWDAMCSALLAHENRHQTVFTDALKEFKSTLEAEDEFDKRKLDSLWKTEKAAIQKKQGAYDKKSKNGENEGVVLNLTEDDPDP